jgi:Cu+-exporting ATPase
MAPLMSFGTQISILKPLETLKDPTLRLSYRSSLPNFTIRHIVSSIAAAKSPPFSVSLDEGLSLEEIGDIARRRDQRAILTRLIFTVLVSIPTFVIGTVYMILLKDSSSVKKFFMKPNWAGNVSRFDWVLLFLATPAMFYSANIFHRNALKETFVMWRKGSKTPILHRLTRFGSMNLLVVSQILVIPIDKIYW